MNNLAFLGGYFVTAALIFLFRKGENIYALLLHLTFGVGIWLLLEVFSS